MEHRYLYNFTLNLSNNNLQILDLSNIDELFQLNCADNDLIHVDVSGCTKLERLHVENNKIRSINCKGCVDLEFIDCSNNKIVSLDLTDYPHKLRDLICEGNPLTEVKVNTNYLRLYIDVNDLLLSNFNSRKLIEKHFPEKLYEYYTRHPQVRTSDDIKMGNPYRVLSFNDYEKYCEDNNIFAAKKYIQTYKFSITKQFIDHLIELKAFDVAEFLAKNMIIVPPKQSGPSSSLSFLGRFFPEKS